MPISIIILTFNSKKYIVDLLNSIYSLLLDEIERSEIEIIIYDNASEDGIEKVIQPLKKNMIFYRSSKNLGYAKGINESSKMAKGEVLVVVNPDSKFEKFDLHTISYKFKRNTKLAVLGFEILGFDKLKEKNAGNFFNPLTFFLYAFGFERMLGTRFSPDNDRRVDFVSGGFVAFRKDFFDKVGGYDENYFMYVEDMDICWRAKKMNFEVEFSKCARILHLGQGSSSREFAISSIYKGLITFYKKNLPDQLIYIKGLLVIKAKLIIFLANLFGKKELSKAYHLALDKIL